ncbi:hypothetical protein GYMLUDRAFT_73450 [Collybiopsis luxurians FD-317 M1]|uniref:Uncharacterized protein n=1 Tax=Collybiopsis luxurians FD-317 M1 TaxID=944289 RepID=A0A0D0BYW5_9AGAR|nr:hypothetical protein GYMLUDRAFT_73450 [Collybiopsis luxurians FD-317 M1]
MSTSAPRSLTQEECSKLFLEPAEIKEFNSSPEGLQDLMLREWKYMKPFLSHFPTQSLPEHFFWTPGKKRPDHKFLWGWATEWDQVYDLVADKFPNAVRRYNDGEPDDVGTSLDAVPLIAEACGLRFLVLQSAFTGPRTSQHHPVFAISNSFQTEEQRQSLPAEGIQKLKEMFGFEGPPMWVVDTHLQYWPSFNQ